MNSLQQSQRVQGNIFFKHTIKSIHIIASRGFHILNEGYLQ